MGAMEQWGYFVQFSMHRQRPVILILLFAALGMPARCQSAVTIADVGWQLALQVKKQKKKYHDIESWLFPPSRNIKLRPRAVLTLRNEGTRNETAVLLRYSFSARLKEIVAPGVVAKAGVWTVPFILEERRIPKIAAGALLKVPLQINRVALGAYLQRMYRSGFWPDVFRVRVLVEPRSGDTLENRIAEKRIAVNWSPSKARSVGAKADE